jgi:TnpA family transposase
MNPNNHLPKPKAYQLNEMNRPKVKTNTIITCGTTSGEAIPARANPNSTPHKTKAALTA